MSMGWHEHAEQAEKLVTEVTKNSLGYLSEQEHQRALIMVLTAGVHATLADVKRIRS